MKEFEYKENIHKLPEEIVDYIEKLEYYFEYNVGTRVMEVHFGIAGYVEDIFENFNNIPSEIVRGSHSTYLEKLREVLPLMEYLLNTYWLLVREEIDGAYYCLPYVYFHIMPLEDEDEDVESNSITDI